MTPREVFKIVHRHEALAGELDEWGWALWWTGLMCLGLSAALLFVGMPARGFSMACLYWPLALLRNACFWRADCHEECARQKLRGLKRGCFGGEG